MLREISYKSQMWRQFESLRHRVPNLNTLDGLRKLCYNYGCLLPKCNPDSQGTVPAKTVSNSLCLDFTITRRRLFPVYPAEGL